MSVIIPGNPASVAYRADVFPSRLSLQFADTSRHLSRFSSNELVPLSVTVPTPEGAFMCVVDFIPDPLCTNGVVLGKDWLSSCVSRGVCTPHDILQPYCGG